MNVREALTHALTSTKNILTWFVADLSDADLLVRPVPGANCVAWQLGHLIQSETRMIAQVPGAQVPELPAGFTERHTKDTAAAEPPTGFLSKEEYLGLFNKVRAATLAAVAHLSEADLDKPTEGPIAKLAPTLGALLLLDANHTVMHAGQFSVVRRKLGKPVLF